MKPSFAKKFVLPFCVLALSIGLTILLWAFVKREVNDQVRVQFESKTAEVSSLIEKKMAVYTNLLYGARGLFSASSSVEAGEWEAYVSTLALPTRYPGVAAMSYLDRVEKAEIKYFPVRIYPEADKAEYMPLLYTSPFSETSSKLVGFDVSSETNRDTALKAALKNDEPTASAVVLSVTTQAPSFSIYLPVYVNGETYADLSERAKNLQGYVVVGFRVSSLFEEIVNDPTYDKTIDMEVYDATNTSEISKNTLLFDADGVLRGTEKHSSRLVQTTKINVDGRVWTLVYSVAPSYELTSVELLAPRTVLYGGIAFSVLISFLIYMLVSAREKALVMATKIASDLEDSQKVSKLSMENAGDMILIMKLGGTFLDANPAAIARLGYTKEEFAKMSFADISTGLNKEDFMKIGDALKQNKTVTVEGELKAKDGSSFPAESRTSVFGEGGNLMAISILRDTTERKKAEAEIMARTSELERLNKFMVGRELKMRELKEELDKKNGA